MAHMSGQSSLSHVDSQGNHPSTSSATSDSHARWSSPAGAHRRDDSRRDWKKYQGSFERWMQFWKGKTLVEKVRLYSVVANSAFIAFMISRYLSERRSTGKLWEDELTRKSREADDWRCYHAHRLFHSQCRDISPIQWPGVHTSISASSSSSSSSPSSLTESADTLCGRLETVLRQCRDHLADLLPQETPAMKPITNITNMPPWLKERPVYIQFFKEKELKETGRQTTTHDRHS
ncbi:hypothetical protein CSUI_008632 [Cystoisospora suis]|uniref:Uncharacterized protein n=1 Tax=Cystoisospora suis TaxID=483139 RepID=A0A2C6KMD4_9APIC|nr:hypothetical protein CSUI_008632 [Cystoisospora suis]